MKKLVNILLVLVEGPSALVDRPIPCSNWAAAEATVRQMRYGLLGAYKLQGSSPTGSYKVDVTLSFEDGYEYDFIYTIDFLKNEPQLGLREFAANQKQIVNTYEL